MELMITFGVLFFLVIYVMVHGKIEETKRKKRYRTYLKESYGSFPDLDRDHLENIPRLFMRESEKVDFALDDITWNDLDLDRIFLLMNHTQSASGAEYLYFMLRTPKQNGKEFEQMEKNISYLMQHEEIRLDLQMILHELGRTGRFSLYDYLDYLDTLGKKRNSRHVLGLVLLLISFASIFVEPAIGVPFLIVVSCFQIGTYLSEKSKVLPYLSSFSYITRMVICAKKIHEKLPESMEDYRHQLIRFVHSLQAFQKGYRILTNMNASTGNPLDLMVDYLKMVTHIDLIMFNNTLNRVLENRAEILELSKTIGRLDAWISIGAFRASLPYYCVPELVEGEKSLDITEGYHPAIQNAVPNSLKQSRGMLITGSNASGKSTFLKMTAINAILSQTVHTATARSYRGDFYQIYSSMALRDNLESGESYYIVEIKALKRIMDAADSVRKDQTQNPLLCFVDEVLRGTNTVERIAASAKILERLSEKRVFCFAATHDIELTHLLEQLYDNYHFEEEVSEGDVLFSYHLMEGRAVTRNAIRLLQVIGFEENIISQADALAGRFLTTGEWK